MSPVLIVAATSSAGANVTGMGHTVPLTSRISLHTDVKSALPMKPVSGENAPMAIISKSNCSRGERVTDL